MSAHPLVHYVREMVSDVLTCPASCFLQPEKVTAVMAVGSFELEPWEKVFPSSGPQLSFLVWRWTCVVAFLCKVSEKPAPLGVPTKFRTQGVCVYTCTNICSYTTSF